VPQCTHSIVATASGKVLKRRLRFDGTPENVPMYPNEFATRLSDLRLLDPTALPLAEGTMEDFNPLEIARLRQAIDTHHGERALLPLPDDELLKALQLACDCQGRRVPTLCGILLLGTRSALERFAPTAKTSLQVLSGARVLCNEEALMPVLEAIEKIEMHVKALNRETEFEQGMYRIGIPDFDKGAVREAVINAFSHRDYTQLGRVRVALSDDGLQISNPGGFISGIRPDRLLQAEPRGRNPALADALKRIGLAERTGRGIDRIYDGSLLYGKPLPDYSLSHADLVSLFIARAQPDLQLTRLIQHERKRLGQFPATPALLVINGLRDAGAASSGQLAQALHLPEAQVAAILSDGMDSGCIVASGAGRAAVYRLSPDVYAQAARMISYRQASKDDESALLHALKKQICEQDFVTRGDVMRELGVNENQAYRLIRKLVEAGKLRAVHKGRYAKYECLAGDKPLGASAFPEADLP
ncbi:MAG: AAA family ATPase, partial [Duodenibacillus sp.]|nr:AAA family ATPase [Duodenibacillus sp.]